MERAIPGFLEEMLKRQYGEQVFERILAGFQAERPVTLRVNPLKSSRAEVREALETAGIGFREVSWYPDGWIIEDAREPRLQELPIYGSGGIYLQSLSSMLPPLFLSPQAGETILDMAAAPGGKTTQMAALSGNKAQITACEKNKVRSERLKYNLEKQGASGALVMVEDARKLDDFFSFDKILLDAPCSGSGTVEVRDGVCRTKITKELVDRSVRTQEELLKKALKLLKPGHVMVYSTCSILEEENEKLLKRVLPTAGGEILSLTDGEENSWLSELPLLPASLAGTVLVGPDEWFEGFFVAKIRKKETRR